MTIHETCKCGAVLDFSTGDPYSMLSRQSNFHKQHKVCLIQQTELPEFMKPGGVIAYVLHGKHKCVDFDWLYSELRKFHERV